MSPSRRIKNKEEEISLPEWIVAGFGLALVCIAFFFLIYKAFFIEQGDPVLDFAVERVVNQDGGALVLAKVSNTGRQTVTALQITGIAANEEHEFEVDFLPARSSRRFGMFFSFVPLKNDVKFRAGGYQEP